MPPLGRPLGLAASLLNRTLSLALIAALLALRPAAAVADILIVNSDGAGEGFNDASARDPVGGNSATTLGEQRLAVFEYAASLWEQVISSPVDIMVQANFDVLSCNGSSAVLGSAGAKNYFKGFANAPRADTWYPSALANKLRGVDNDPGQADITATFNSTIGTTCAFPSEFYYGLDGNPPGGQIDLATVVLHELGHGLGFATIVDLATGQKGLGTGFDDAFMLFLEDHSTGEFYPGMTNAERLTASTDTGDLHWVGDTVVGASSRLASGAHSPSGHVQMFAPSPAQPGSSVSHWDTALTPNELMEPSYTGPLHDVGFARELFNDIGWQTITTTTVSTSTTTTTTTVPDVTTSTSPTTTTSSSSTTTTTVPLPTTLPPTTTTTVTLPATSTTQPSPSSTLPPTTTTTLPAVTTTTLQPATTTTLPANTTTTAVQPTTTAAPGTTSTLPATTSTTNAITTTSTLGGTTTTLEETRGCGDFSGDESITASDALAVLRVAVASLPCSTCVCDTNGSGFITASDALTVLRHAVGLGTALTCPAC